MKKAHEWVGKEGELHCVFCTMYESEMMPLCADTSYTIKLLQLNDTVNAVTGKEDYPHSLTE